MFAMSAKLVPVWSVTIEPRLIGVPVAATPALVPHDEVLTAALELGLELDGAAAALEVAPVAALLELELLLLLLHPARTPPIAMTATAAPASRERRCSYLFMCSAFSWLTANYCSERTGGILPVVIMLAQVNYVEYVFITFWPLLAFCPPLSAPSAHPVRVSSRTRMPRPSPQGGTSISFSGKIPGRTGAVAADMPTMTTRPAWLTASVASLSAGPAPLASMISGGPSPSVQSLAAAATCSEARVERHEHGGKADRPGTEDQDLRLGERGASGVQVARGEHGARGDVQALLQAAVEMDARQAQAHADVGAPGPARVAVPAPGLRHDRHPHAGLQRGRHARAQFGDHRGDLVALNSRVKVLGARQRAGMAGKVVQVGSADPHGLRSHDYAPSARRAGLGNIVDDDISRRSGDCREHRGRPLSGRHGAAKLARGNQSTGENCTGAEREQLRRVPNRRRDYCGGPQTSGVALATKVSTGNAVLTLRG